MSDEKQRVVCAAIKHKESGLIICGARHFDEVMVKLIQDREESWATADQGFIDQWGNFLTRQEAFTIAKRMEQIRDVPNIEGTLFSEDLY